MPVFLPLSNSVGLQAGERAADFAEQIAAPVASAANRAEANAPAVQRATQGALRSASVVSRRFSRSRTRYIVGGAYLADGTYRPGSPRAAVPFQEIRNPQLLATRNSILIRIENLVDDIARRVSAGMERGNYIIELEDDIYALRSQVSNANLVHVNASAIFQLNNIMLNSLYIRWNAYHSPVSAVAESSRAVLRRGRFSPL